MAKSIPCGTKYGWSYAPPLYQQQNNTGNTEIFVFRCLVVFCLFSVAAICGSLSYILIRDYENDKFESQFHALSGGLGRSVDEVVRKFEFSCDELSTFSISYCIDASEWPNCGIPQYNVLAEDVTRVTGGTASSVIPIVYPDEQEAFEAYAVDFIANDPFLSQFPQLHALFGINGVFNLTDGNVVHDTSGVVPSSSRRFVTPILNTQEDITKSGFLLVNVRTIVFVAEAMDNALDCHEVGHSRCSSMSDFNDDLYENPESSIFCPIVSLDNESVVVGFSSVTFNWASEIEKVSPGISSLVIVLSSSTGRVHTFFINEGKSKYMGQGDLHDKEFSYLYMSFILSMNTSAGSVDYTMRIYPTNDFASEHRSDAPIYTSAGAVTLIIFTSIIFFSYDYLVKAEGRAKSHLLKIKRDFVRFISHEIRTPLNTVAVGLSLMEDSLTKNREMPVEECIELTRDMQSGVEVAVSVLNDLLNFDKLEAGEFDMSNSPIRIWNLVEGVARSFRNTALQKGIKLTFRFVRNVDSTLHQNKLVVFGDSMKLSQVMRNLISNALKFTGSKGQIDVTVTWSDLPEKSRAMFEMGSDDHDSLDVPAGKVVVAVKDTGYGISKENLRLLFRDGMQFKPNELQAGQGSGLGLFLSFKIVQMHGGRMWAVSDGEHKGACFFVELQVFTTKRSLSDSFAKHRNSAAPQTSTSLSVPSCYSGRPYSEVECFDDSFTGVVLVVDDTSSNRKMVCRILRNRGYECIEAKDGIEAIREVTESGRTFDCILMDFEMPGMNGPDATKELRELGYMLPIIGLTGNVMIDDIHYFINSGADQVLAKPFQVEQFVSIMNQNQTQL